MQRPYTLFTGQWADLPLEEVAKLASQWGYDGLEIAVSKEHLNPYLHNDKQYIKERLNILKKHNLQVYAISNHLTGQAICDDPIDFRHKNILRPEVWQNGNPEEVRKAAAQEMQLTAKLAQNLGVNTIVGFTGSAIWKHVAMFPPVSEETIAQGYKDFANRWHPILDTFDQHNVRFAHEVHPSEIAYDYWTTKQTLTAINNRETFGLNWDPSHFIWQQIDPVNFITDFANRIYHVDCKDTKLKLNGRNTILSSHLPWGHPNRGWDFVSAGRGDVPWESAFRALNAINYTGPISVEWEDASMDRLEGAPQALKFLKQFNYNPPKQAFDTAFGND